MDKIKEFLIKLNKDGIPLPLLQSNGKGSATYTMYWISFNISVICLAGKATKHFDISYSDALWFYGVSAFIYLGRKFQLSKDGIKVESGTEGESQ